MTPDDLKRALSRGSAGPVPEVIVHSWTRSRLAEVDADARPTFRRSTPEEVHQRQEANRLLIDAAKPHLAWLHHWFHDRPHVAYLVDAEGVVVHSTGDPDTIDAYGLWPGTDWSEAAMGTNGAGTALMSGAPVAVVGCDHWVAAWHDATCLGAPVRDRTGRIAGAIDISMDVRPGDAERLVVVAHVAYTISQELARREAEAETTAAQERYEAVRRALDAETRARADAESALELLRVSEGKLQTIIDSTPAIVYVVDAQSRFQLINRMFAETFGLTAREVVGRPLFDYFPDEVAEQFATNNRAVLAAGHALEFEERVSLHDGVHTFVTVKAPLASADGTLSAICGVSTDITERKRLSSALEAAHRQKDTLITTVAHELRQPLGAIRSAAAVVRAGVGPEQQERALRLIDRHVDQLARLVDDLLDAARVAQGKVSLQPQPTSIHEVLEAAVSVALAGIQGRSQHLDVRLPAEPVRLHADPARLQQVFANLLVNASKFTPDGGTITLAAEAADGRLRVTVRDTGRGIDPGLLPTIFELFAQASPENGGLGIGLAVVRGLVERHGGTVEAHSGGPGLGSEFRVTLPLGS